MSIRKLILGARAKPVNPKADMIEALVLVGIALFILGLIVGIGASQ